MNDKKTEKRWLNVKEAAAYLGVSRQTLYKLLAAGKLRYFEIDGVQGKKLQQKDLDALFREISPKRGPSA